MFTHQFTFTFLSAPAPASCWSALTIFAFTAGMLKQPGDVLLRCNTHNTYCILVCAIAVFRIVECSRLLEQFERENSDKLPVGRTLLVIT